jgi:hypothetical protein
VEIPSGAVTGSDPSLAIELADAATAASRPPAPEPEADHDIDEDFLRRIREI